MSNYSIKENEIIDAETKSMKKIVHDWESEDESWGVTVIKENGHRLHEFTNVRDINILCCCCAKGGTGSLN